MEPVFFYIFSALAVLSAVMVVWNPLARNTVTNAMFLVVTMLSVSGLFVLLHAWFMAAVQVIVYAGAVMVLFLFVIMLLDVQAEKKRRLRIASVVLSLVVAVSSIGIFQRVLFSDTVNEATASVSVYEGTTSTLGKLLFTQYLLPFEIISVLLLAAMLGVILLSKKELK